MNTSEKGLDLIKQFEGFKDYVYICPAGKPTIGYGHVVPSELIKSFQSTSPISIKQAEKLLKNDVTSVENIINSSVDVSLKQGQFDALVSLIFNWGASNFKASNGFVELNSGNYDDAATEFFSKEKGIVDVNGKFCEGLYRRRQAELKLWQS